MPDIFDLWREVTRHPDYAGGTVFIHGGDTQRLPPDALALLQKDLEDALAVAGNRVIDTLGFGPEEDL